MPAPEFLTVERFIAEREELPDGGRWTELLAGRLVIRQPPTIEHGTAVLNLSKALADFTQRERGGYACFDLGLIVARNPDTVQFPAVSYFAHGPMFAEADKVATETAPALVAEIASTNDRRRGLQQRVAAWLEWGVRLVWVLDPDQKQVHVFQKNVQAHPRSAHQSLLGGTVLTGFDTNVGSLFEEPRWAK